MSGVKHLIEDKIKQIIADRLKVKIEEIKMESRLIEDLGADSLSGVEIIMDLEQEFNISIPDENTKSFLTIKDVINHLKKILKS